MFSGSYGHQFHHTNFYQVSGDVNLETHHHLTPSAPAHRLLEAVPAAEDTISRQLPEHLRHPQLEGTRPEPHEISSCSRRLAGSPEGGSLARVGFPSTSTVMAERSLHGPHLPRVEQPAGQFLANEYAGRGGLLEASRHPSRKRARLQPYELSSHPRHGNDRSPPARFPSANTLREAAQDRRLFRPLSPSFHENPGDPQIPRPPFGTHPATVINANNVNRHYHSNNDGTTGLAILHRSVALDALYNSAESFPQPRCHPATRMELLEQLHGWVVGNKPVKPIFWLHGPAGAGKSAIMQTLCRRLENESRLKGAFFFKRGPAPRGNANALFATLAYQLAIHPQARNAASHPSAGPPYANDRVSHLGLKRLILQQVERDPSVVARDMDIQLRALIVEPCLALGNGKPIVLLIDGLDECAGEGAQARALRLIADTAHKHPHAFRLIIASRPEAHIREVLDDAHSQGTLHTVNIEQSFDDVRRFLRHEFSRIHHEHKGTMSDVPAPWPSDEAINSLVEKSSGYFIYAATVIRFIDDKYFRPTERLAMVQNIVHSGDSESPLRALDELYTEILSKIPAQHRKKLCIIFCAIKANLGISVDLIEQLLGLSPGDFMLILRGLHSLIKVPFCLDGSREFSFYHASFLDYLGNPAQSSVFHVGENHRTQLTCSILKALSLDEDAPLARALRQPFMKRENNETCWATYIFSVLPSEELVPHLSLLNPDHLGWRTYPHFARGTVEMNRWLQKIKPTPENLIRQWKDYEFLVFYEWLIHRVLGELAIGWQNLNQHCTSGIKLPCKILQPSLEAVIRIESKMGFRQPSPGASKSPSLPASPPLRRILYALHLLYTDKHRAMEAENCSLLFKIRWLLDMPWQEMAAALGSLQSVLDKDPLKLCRMFLQMPHLWQELHSTVSRDLAVGILGTLRLPNISQSPSPRYHRLSKAEAYWLPWGKYVRASPPHDPELLRAIGAFNPMIPFESVRLHGGPTLDSERVDAHRLVGFREQVEFHDAWQWIKFSHGYVQSGQ